MVVSFTPNLGLAKPSEAELGANWVNGTDLSEDNNLIIEDKTDINLVSYVPSFIGSTTNPNVGAGSVQGEYYEIQGWIFGHFVIQFLDPGVASGTGSGAYGISLPFLADTTFHAVGSTLSDFPGVAHCIGEGAIIDNTVALGGTLGIDIVHVGGTAYARMITETFPTKTARFVTPGQPMLFANNDKMTGSFTYKKA